MARRSPDSFPTRSYTCPPIPFFIVDVFAEEKYAGNQLAVFTEAAALSSGDMQRLAKEMHFSESTFLLSREPRDGGYDVRIFTPEAEVPFAGHPTLGTAFVIQQEILKTRVDTVTLNLPVGPIPVTFMYLVDDPDILWMRQPTPEFGTTFAAEIAGAGARPRRRGAGHALPGAGGVHRPAIRRGAGAEPGGLETGQRWIRDRCLTLLADAQAKALLVFSPETVQGRNDLSVRVFADYYGVPEDPATGSANGCLAAYLVRHRYFDSDRIDVRVEQGHAVGRPSLLYLKAGEDADGIAVSVGGGVKMIAHGSFL